MSRIEQLQLLAKQGDPSAQFQLSAKYALGSEVALDYSAARDWMRMAADQGHLKAQYQLGQMYRNGLGVPPDPEEACRWYRKAAEQGLGNARFALAYAYLSGEGVEEDFGEAYYWFLLATGRSDKIDIANTELRMEMAEQFLDMLDPAIHPVERIKAALLMWCSGTSDGEVKDVEG